MPETIDLTAALREIATFYRKVEIAATEQASAIGLAVARRAGRTRQHPTLSA